MKESKTPLRMQRVVIAALLAELIPIIVLMAVVISYGYIAAPEQSPESYKVFAEKAGRIIKPLVGTLATLGMAYWAANKTEQNHLKYGLYTGLVVILIELAILATPETTFSLATIFTMLGSLVGGAFGGYLAQKRYLKRQASGQTGHRLI